MLKYLRVNVITTVFRKFMPTKQMTDIKSKYARMLIIFDLVIGMQVVTVLFFLC